jgi:hypothetical protein
MIEASGLTRFSEMITDAKAEVNLDFDRGRKAVGGTSSRESSLGLTRRRSFVTILLTLEGYSVP